MTRRRIGAPTRKSIDDIWHRRATAAAIVAVRELINAGGAIPPATPVSRLSDIELGWFTAANLFAWIKCRSEQATAEGWNTELALRLTGMDPDPWDAGAVESDPAGARRIARLRLVEADHVLAEEHDGSVPAGSAEAGRQGNARARCRWRWHHDQYE